METETIRWGVVVRPDGSYTVIAGTEPSLDELQAHVGGYIEAIPRALVLFGDLTVLCCEEPPDDAIRNGMADNLTTIDHVRGPIVLMGPADHEGDFTPLADVYRNYVTAMCDLHAHVTAQVE